ncbi:hypothetical protein [Enterococcus malodoratus]|uniref:hypothetical protein n=1 Tax=Enterococcus malodoratus TaxID=71451 RepID=UPI0039AFA27A
MYEEWDYYCEPSLADEIFGEAEQKLRKALKPDIKKEMEEKDKEISRLDEIVQELRSENIELRGKYNQASTKVNEIEKNIKNQFLETIVAPFCKPYFSIRSGDSVERKETIKTDDPDIEVIKTIYKSKYFVDEVNMKYIFRAKISDENSILFEYNSNEEGGWMDTRKLILHESFDESKLDEKWQYKNVFENIEDAQKYADYLNDKEEEQTYSEIKRN